MHIFGGVLLRQYGGWSVERSGLQDPLPWADLYLERRLLVPVGNAHQRRFKANWLAVVTGICWLSTTRMLVLPLIDDGYFAANRRAADSL